MYFFGLINTLNMDYGYNFLAKNLSFIAFPFIFFAIGKHVQIRNVYKAYLIGLCLTDLFLMYLFFYNYNFGTKFYMIVTIEIYNMNGQLISKQNYSNVYGRVQLNLDDKPKGVYVAKLNLDKPVVLKIVKQ